MKTRLLLIFLLPLFLFAQTSKIEWKQVVPGTEGQVLIAGPEGHGLWSNPPFPKWTDTVSTLATKHDLALAKDTSIYNTSDSLHDHRIIYLRGRPVVYYDEDENGEMVPVFSDSLFSFQVGELTDAGMNSYIKIAHDEAEEAGGYFIEMRSAPSAFDEEAAINPEANFNLSYDDGFFAGWNSVYGNGEITISASSSQLTHNEKIILDAPILELPGYAKEYETKRVLQVNETGKVTASDTISIGAQPFLFKHLHYDAGTTSVGYDAGLVFTHHAKSLFGNDNRTVLGPYRSLLDNKYIVEGDTLGSASLIMESDSASYSFSFLGKAAGKASRRLAIADDELSIGITTDGINTTGLHLEPDGALKLDVVNVASDEYILTIGNDNEVHKRAVSGLPGGGGTADVASGTYTPTLTNVSNISSSTAYACQYMRVGATVTVSGRLYIDKTADNVSTSIGITLPVASDLVNDNECAGTAAAVVNTEAGTITGDVTNNRAQLTYTAKSSSDSYIWFTFTYKVN